MAGKYVRKTAGTGALVRAFLIAAVIILVAAALWKLGNIWLAPEPESEPKPVGDSLIPGLDRNLYDLESFSWQDGYIRYDGNPKARCGIDVSSHQGDIDWAAVAADGVEYAMIRVGYRGYTEGLTSLDPQFYTNVGGAVENGIDVGVYFFSQAITEAEAVEEAETVLRAIEGLEITYPIIFDWEDIPQEARTDGMDPLTLTACAEAFCKTIEDAGYTAGIYFNQVYGYQEYDLKALDNHLFWLAQYNDAPTFPYDFEMWQYTNAGAVDGIAGNVDLNLSFWQPD